MCTILCLRYQSEDIESRLFQSVINFYSTQHPSFTLNTNSLEILDIFKTPLLIQPIMASPCIASSKLALPSVLRSIFRAEFASELRPQYSSYNQARLLSLRPAHLPYRGFQSKRTITTSRSQSQEVQSEQPPSSSTEPSTATDNSDPSQFDHIVEGTPEDKIKHAEKSQSRTKSSRNPPDAKSKNQKPPRMLPTITTVSAKEEARGMANSERRTEKQVQGRMEPDQKALTRCT